MKDIPAAEGGESDFYSEPENPFENTGWSRIRGNAAELFREPPRRAPPPIDTKPTKQQLRRELDGFVAVYLAAGGKVKQCPPGKPPKFRPSGRPVPWYVIAPSGMTRRRWTEPGPSEAEERDLMRAARDGDEWAKRRLVEHFHKQCLRQAREYYGPPPDDLMGAALGGLWQAILRFNLKSNRGRLSTYAKYWIKKAISDAVKDWRKQGIHDESRAARYAYDKPNATVGEICAVVGSTLKRGVSVRAAEDAINQLAAIKSYDTTEPSHDEDDYPVGPKGAVLVPRDFLDERARAFEGWEANRIKEIGLWAYALERVNAAPVPVVCLYRTKQPLRERVRIAARIELPAFEDAKPPLPPSTSDEPWRLIVDQQRIKQETLRQQQRAGAIPVARTKWPTTPFNPAQVASNIPGGRGPIRIARISKPRKQKAGKQPDRLRVLLVPKKLTPRKSWRAAVVAAKSVAARTKGEVKNECQT